MSIGTSNCRCILSWKSLSLALVLGAGALALLEARAQAQSALPKCSGEREDQNATCTTNRTCPAPDGDCTSAVTAVPVDMCTSSYATPADNCVDQGDVLCANRYACAINRNGVCQTGTVPVPVQTPAGAFGGACRIP